MINTFTFHTGGKEGGDLIFRQISNDVGDELRKLMKFSRKEKIGVEGKEDQAAVGTHLQNVQEREVD